MTSAISFSSGGCDFRLICRKGILYVFADYVAVGCHPNGLGPANVTVTPESRRAGQGCSGRDAGDDALFVGGQATEVVLDLNTVPELV